MFPVLTVGGAGGSARDRQALLPGLSFSFRYLPRFPLMLLATLVVVWLPGVATRIVYSAPVVYRTPGNLSARAVEGLSDQDQRRARLPQEQQYQQKGPQAGEDTTGGNAGSTSECGVWTIVSTPRPGEWGGMFLYGVEVVGRDDVWAVGSYGYDDLYHPLAEHWDGTGWTIVTAEELDPVYNYPLYPGGQLLSVSAVSHDDVWAVGYYTRYLQRPIMEHWDGTKWSVVPGPEHSVLDDAIDAELMGVAAVATDDVWAAGWYEDAQHNTSTLIMHWDGNEWSVVPSPNPGQPDPDTSLNALKAIAAISADDIWAVGYQHNQAARTATLALHWDGVSWSAVPSPNTEDGYTFNMVNAVDAVSSDDVWMVGETTNSQSRDSSAPMALHWDGTEWKVIPTPALRWDSEVLRGVAAVAPNEVWAVGTLGPVDTDNYRPLVQRWNGSVWTTVSANDLDGEDVFYAASFKPGGDLWAVGQWQKTPPGVPQQPLVERYAYRGFADMVSGTGSTLSSFYPYVSCLACQGIISGYECGGAGEPCDSSNTPYFRPGAPVSRGQIAKMVSQAAGFDEDAGEQIFEDVPPSSPFYSYINRLANRGVMGGYPCGTVEQEPCSSLEGRGYFRPNGHASRGQIAKIVANAAGYVEAPDGQSFADVTVGSTFYEWVQRLASRSIMGGYPCGVQPEETCDSQARPYFRSAGDVTRGQVAKIVAGVFFPDCRTPASP